MTTKELRQGNLILLVNYKYEPKHSDKAHEVIAIRENEVLIKEIATRTTFSYCQNIKYIESITLNEDWLMRLGFRRQQSANSFFFYHPDVMIRIDKILGEFRIADRENPIISVHQLQNIVFCLADKELTIK